MKDYFRAYRDDEEMYVYDQCCGNCAINEDGCCPLKPQKGDKEDEARAREVERKRKEDAVLHDGEPEWCIYWKQRRGCR